MKGAWLGIDLGGTKIYGVVHDTAEVRAEAKRKTPAGGPEAVVDTIGALVDDLGGTKGINGAGIGAPGAVDRARGVVLQAPNLAGWDREVALAEMVAKELGGLPVVIDNDVNAGTLAEQRLGAGRGIADVLGVFVGTGVGGGLVLDGELRRGPTGFAGEIGHTVVHPGGRACGCGGQGHLEAYAGRAGIEREARHRHGHGTVTALVDLAGKGRMTSGVIEKALQAGDPLALELLDDAVEALGLALATAVTMLDLPLVVLGGGLADRLGAAFGGRVEQAARSQLFAMASPLRVVPADLGDRGGAVGAALLAADSV